MLLMRKSLSPVICLCSAVRTQELPAEAPKGHPPSGHCGAGTCPSWCLLPTTTQKITAALPASSALLNCLFLRLPTAETGFQLHSCRGVTEPSLRSEKPQRPWPCQLLPSPSISQLLNRPNLATSLGLGLAVGSHGGVATTPGSEFGLRLP